MRICYTAGPYRAKTQLEIELNIDKAEVVAIELWQMGYAVICPHKNTALFHVFAPRKVFLQGDLEIISRLQGGKDCIVMLPGWEDSQGAVAEKFYAEHRGLKIYCWPQDKESLKKSV